MAESESKWSSLTDTGSLQPSAEALDWQRRADAWAQQAESDPHQAVEPANRWSDAAASTGRTTFPADGVGWRTETAEWRATGARWRQTTEWRSTTGTHVWRSTTEAWQTGDEKPYPPEAETPMAQPAISNTAWSEEAADDSRPSWQQYAGSSAEPERSGRSSPGESTVPSWQQPSQRTPAESSPSWQKQPEPDRQPSRNSRPSWQRDAIEGSATWTDLTDQRSAAAADTGTAWPRPDDARDDGRHLVREDDRAAWRRDAGGESPSVGRRRAPEPGYAPSGGTGWSGSRSDAEIGENTDSWAGHTDTGGIQLYGDTPAQPPSAWGTGFGSRNVNRREEARRETPSAYGDGPGYEIPPATPYESSPRQSRRDDTSSGRALPTGGYDQTPRQRYAPEDEPPRYTDDAPEGRSRRARRYADDPEPPRPGDPGSYTPPEPRAPRRARAEADETATFSAVPMPAPPPSTAQRSAVPMPAPPPTAAQRSAVPMPAQPPTAAQRSAVPMPAQRSAVPMPPSSASRSGPPKGRARYNAGGSDWREQTGSWEAEPDTSSWVRDPDTGQWSRSDDDPRILAWRREADRREAMGEGPRALLPPPLADEPSTGREAQGPEQQPPTGWRKTSPPPLPPGPSPRSAVPWGGGVSPTSSVPDRDPYDQPRGYSAAPTDRKPFDQPRGYSAAPAGAGPDREPYGDPRGYGAAPSSSVPGRDPVGYGGSPASSIPDSEPRYGAPPAGRNPYEEPRGYGAAPSSSVPDRDQPRGYGSSPYGAAPAAQPRGYSATPAGSMPDREPYDPPQGSDGYGAVPGRESYGAAPTSSVPGRRPYDSPQGNDGYGAAPTSAVPGRGPYDQPGGYGSAPTSSVPARGPYGAAPTGSLPARDPYDIPRGAAPTSSVPARDDPYDPPRGAAPTSYDAPRGYAPTSSVPAREPYDQPSGYAPASSQPARDPYDEPRGYAPTSSVPARDPYDEPRGYSSAPNSSIPRRDPGDERGGNPRRGYRDEPGDAPRSGTAYGTGPYSGQPALPSAPRSAPGYGGPDTAPAGYSGSSPVSAPRGTPGYTGAAPLPTDSSRFSSAAPSSGPQYIPVDEPQRSGRRRAEADEPTTRHSAVDPNGYAPEPLTPDVWQPGTTSPNRARPDAWQPGTPSPDRAGPDDVPPWSRGEPTGAPPPADPGQWHLEERRERARGSATYRDGGDNDWRRDLAEQSELAEGESRRFGTSDYVPFRTGGSAAVSGQSNLSTTSTSLIAPVAREAAAAPPRAAASWNGPSGAYERRPVAAAYPTGRKNDLLDPDDEEDGQESGSPLAAVGYTVIWYGVPVVLFVVYMLVVGTGAQGHALGTLAKAAPQFLISLVLSVLVALGLRFVSHSWKAISVGLAAAVVGGGLATVLTSAITGNSLS